MPARRLPNESWESALARVESYTKPVALAWAAITQTLSSERVFTVSVREAEVDDCLLVQDNLEIGVSVQSGSEAAGHLRSASPHPMVKFSLPQQDSGIGYWVTSGQQYGVTSTLAVPSYYFDMPLDTFFVLPGFDAPIFGGGRPYYPTGHGAVLELLYGVTRDQGRFDLRSHLVIRLPYMTDAG